MAKERIKSTDEIADEQAAAEAKYDARQAKEAAAEPVEAKDVKNEGKDVKEVTEKEPSAEPADTPAKPKSHLQEWWENTPLGGALTAVGEDLKAHQAANTGKTAEIPKEDPNAPDASEGNVEPHRGRDVDSDGETPPKSALPAGAVAATPAAGGAVVQADTSANTDKYYKGVEESMGANASEYLQKAQASARGLAEEQAKQSALGAARASLSAAKTSGLNAGEAALSSGAQAGQTYGDIYGQQVNQGINQYSTATGQFGTLAGQRSGEQLTARGQDIAAKTASNQLAAQTAEANAQRQTQNTMGWLGFGANVLGALLSDENAKKNIQPTMEPTKNADVSGVLAKLRTNSTAKQPIAVQKTTVEQVLAKVRPVKFDYKDEGDGANRVGVIAQDIEKSPLKAAVIDTPQGKAIDTAQLTGGNTAMILELAQMVNDLRKELAQVKGK